MKGRVIVLIVFVLFSFPVPVKSISKTIVINSFKIAGEKSTDEYVELYNVSSAKINIKGWQLVRKNKDATTKYNLVTSFPSADIFPGESLIVGHRDSTEVPNIPYSNSSNSITADSTIVLYSDAGGTLVDMVGFGNAKESEVKPLPDPESNVWRRTNGIDSDNNFNDFKKVYSNVDYSGICLSEIMPAPEEGEEWIEIYNSEMTKEIGGLVLADKLGAVKKFTVPQKTVINEGQYLVFYKKATGITLNNDDDGVVLIGNGKIFDDSGNFGKTAKGSSYSFDGKSWRWTNSPTPGSKNIISTEETITSQKRVSSGSTAITEPQKGTLPQAEVLGSQNENVDGLFNEKQKSNSANDQLLGYVLIGVALIGGFLYTLFINKEKLLEVFDKERGRYQKAWEKFWGKIKGR